MREKNPNVKRFFQNVPKKLMAAVRALFRYDFNKGVVFIIHVIPDLFQKSIFNHIFNQNIKG